MNINWTPHHDTLKAFGAGSLLGFGGLGAMAWWRWDMPGLAGTCVGAGALCLMCGLFFPRAARALYLGTILLCFPVGFVISHILMAILYYGLMTPIGLIMRALGRDPLQRTIDHDAPTYWQAHPPPRSAERYYKQY